MAFLDDLGKKLGELEQTVKEKIETIRRDAPISKRINGKTKR
jgi:hypothetical protein